MNKASQLCPSLRGIICAEAQWVPLAVAYRVALDAEELELLALLCDDVEVPPKRRATSRRGQLAVGSS